MRILRAIAITGVVLAFAASLVPALAECGSAQLVTTVGPNTADNRSYVWTDGWEIIYYAPGYPPATLSGLPPVTAEFFAVYWAAGTGNSLFGTGDDSGQYTVPPAGWVDYTLLAGAYPKGALVEGTWAQSTNIDGCIEANGACECLLMTDERDGIGYFAIGSAATDGNGNAYFVQEGLGDGNLYHAPYILKPIPAPDVTSVDLNEDTMVETWNVTVADPVDGVYPLDGCDCGPNQYQLYYQAVAAGTGAPVSRNAADWTPIGDPTAMGGPASFLLDCAAMAGDMDVYLATGLVFDSGMPGTYKNTLSANSAPVLCGPTIADPVELQPKYRYDRREVPRPERKR